MLLVLQMQQNDVSMRQVIQETLQEDESGYFCRKRSESMTSFITVFFETETLCTLGHVDWYERIAKDEFMRNEISRGSFLSLPWLSAKDGSNWSDPLKQWIDLRQGTEEKHPIGLAVIGDCLDPKKSDAVESSRYHRLADDAHALNQWIRTAKSVESKIVDWRLVVCKDRPTSDLNNDRLLSDLLSMLQQEDLGYAVLYGGGCSGEEKRVLSYATRRGLQESQNSTCDSKCRVQVNFLEGFLACMVLLIILLIGLACLGYLETPTKFLTEQH